MKKKQGECGEEARRLQGKSKENVWGRRGRDEVTKITGEK